jgi:hypothetical protein
MSFYEWWAESNNPGPMGKIELRDEEHERCQWAPLVWARFLLVAIGLPVLWGVSASMIPLPWYQAGALVVGISLIYIAVSYMIEVKPDMSNVGWAGGLVDDPFRYSDDVNRQLMGLECLLGPGKFVVESVVDWSEMVLLAKDDSPEQPTSEEGYVGQNWSDPFQNAGEHEETADRAVGAAAEGEWAGGHDAQSTPGENWYASQ